MGSLSLRRDTTAETDDTSSLLDDGFAMATTDTGHESQDDPSFYRDD